MEEEAAERGPLTGRSKVAQYLSTFTRVTELFLETLASTDFKLKSTLPS
jgi:hypothetical protein